MISLSNTKAQSAEIVAGNNTADGASLLSGILSEIDHYSIQENVIKEVSDSDSDSNEGPTCYMETSEFFNGDDEKEERFQTENFVKVEVETNFMTDEWKWNNCFDLGDEEEIEGQ